jgi:Glycogen recognition site of AMP-activated protein kinase
MTTPIEDTEILVINMLDLKTITQLAQLNWDENKLLMRMSFYVQLIEILKSINNTDVLYYACKYGKYHLVKHFHNYLKNKYFNAIYFYFYIACKHNHLDTAQYFWNNYSDRINLHQLAHENDYNEKELVIIKKYFLETSLWTTRSISRFRRIDILMGICCKNNCVPILNFLLGKINNKIHEIVSWEVLIFCCTNGNVELLKSFYNTGFETLALHWKNDEPFRLACRFQHLETAKYLWTQAKGTMTMDHVSRDATIFNNIKSEENEEFINFLYSIGYWYKNYVLVQFEWPYDANSVKLYGSFNDWTYPKRMIRNGNSFTVKIFLLKEVRYYYNFLIDDNKRCYDMNKLSVDDGSGGKNNFIQIY